MITDDLLDRASIALELEGPAGLAYSTVREELRCSHETASATLKRLEAEGYARKIPFGRGFRYVWVRAYPASLPDVHPAIDVAAARAAA